MEKWEDCVSQIEEKLQPDSKWSRCFYVAFIVGKKYVIFCLKSNWCAKIFKQQFSK